MNPPESSRPALRLLLPAALLAALAIAAFLLPPREAERTPSDLRQRDHSPATEGSPAPALSDQPLASRSGGASGARPLTPAPDPTASPAAVSFALARTAEGRIAPESFAEFTPQPYPGGPPAYDGEPVTAYIAVPSAGRKVALTVNQLGEFPRIPAEPGEQVEVRLAFTSTAPGIPIALVARDGGKLNAGKVSAALSLDGSRQLAFGFTVSPNIGMHQISVTTPAGEIKTLEFWAGPPPILMQAAK